MEKRNTILLTVIAIATLLVAVVGATFAYFTAQVTVADNDNKENNTVNVTTYALTSVEMDMGSSVSSEGMYPGGKLAKDFTITGTCPNGAETCGKVNAVITVTTAEDGSDNVFGSDIGWKLYKMSSTSASVTCTSNIISEGGKYYDAIESCTGLDGAEQIATGTGVGSIPKTVEVEGSAEGTKTKYYLVVEYNNNEDSEYQNKQQGHKFSVSLSFGAETGE